uniref:Protein FAM33A n=1 Tax=Callorhinus ursinus TaxID=34884 RepID=A0A3Q7NF52_CALUR|nr:spindle and kinetochore-associated protein 2-like [Callorhinus ursinus]
MWKRRSISWSGRLEYEIKTNHPDAASKKNPVTLLKELSEIKSRYQTLHACFKPIAAEQKETKNCICATVNKTVSMIQERQKQTDLELSPLTKEEKTAAEQLQSFMSGVPGLSQLSVCLQLTIAVSKAPGLLMGCKLRVSQECGSIAVEQILGSMDSSTENDQATWAQGFAFWAPGQARVQAEGD